MDQEYFRDSKSGGFSLRRLPPIKSPIRVTDITELGEYAPDYRGMSFEAAVSHYQANFDNYELDVADHEEVFDNAPAEYLGDLAVFRKDYRLLQELISIDRFDDDSRAIHIPPALGKRLSSKADSLVRVFKPSGFEAISAALGVSRVAELKDACSALGLPVSGKKADLVERLASQEIANPGTVPLPTVVMPKPALKKSFPTNV